MLRGAAWQAGAVVVAGNAAAFLLWCGGYLRRAQALRRAPWVPGGNPFVGHALHLAGASPWDVFEGWLVAGVRGVREAVVAFRILHKHMVLTDDADVIKQIFSSRMKCFEKDLGFSYYPFLPILGTGLVTSEGALWQKQRIMVSSHLRIEILDDIVEIADKATERLAQKLEALRGTGAHIEMAEEFRHVTLQVIGEAILSLTPEEADRVFPHLYLPIMEEANARVFSPWREWLPTSTWFAHKRNVRALNRYIKDILRQRWAARYPDGEAGGPARPPADIVDRIMDSMVSKGERWNAVAETQLCYEIKTFVLAGHETSAAMLAWSLYELSQHPECRRKAVAEANGVFTGPGVVPSRDAVAGMDYCLGVLKESLRKYSVVPVVTRTAAQAIRLNGHEIPVGTVVGVVIQAVHNSAKYWPEPERYRPERFLPGAPIQPCTFLPFIEGPRNCLGQHLALLEGRVVLAKLIQRFTFTPVDDREGTKHPTVVPIAPLFNMRMTVD